MMDDANKTVGPENPTPDMNRYIGVNKLGEMAMVADAADGQLAQFSDMESPFSLGWWKFPLGTFTEAIIGDFTIPNTLMMRHRRWEVAAFGDRFARNGIGNLRHAVKEIEGEIIPLLEEKQDIGEICDYRGLCGEFADVFLLLLGAMYRSPVIFGDVIVAMEEKLPVLESRTYPQMPEGEASEHIRDADE
ncbi:hypothetical protein LOKG_00056 [Loktanella phage pCB2051-A]|uniref:dATP/dGTP diphosphohydrolase MazZ domain-containing protein n=1 Tax=Loktanella phage pCB2051-A TaxID=754044 RepID=M4R1A4_9CAUD|nr:hypothetical protein LOKG_00056 [Loktanella phage pCB2051-A]AGH31492.1 hypothetical protein LOKG_00056 [Loktanella phage pCB2051-A]